MGEYTLAHEHFGSINEMLKTIMERPNNKDMKGERASNKNDKEWCGGTKSLEEAIEAVPKGWSEAEKNIKKMVISQKKENLKLFQIGKASRQKTAVAGYRPCVPAAIIGLPKSMYKLAQSPKKKKAVHILYILTGSAGEDSEWFEKAGAALLTAVEAIETMNIMIKIDLGIFCAQSGDEIALATIPLKRFNERWSLQKLSFPLGNTGMFRRIGFKWLETATKTQKSYRGGYGQPVGIGTLRRELNTEDRVVLTPEWINENNCSVPEIIKEVLNRKDG